MRRLLVALALAGCSTAERPPLADPVGILLGHVATPPGDGMGGVLIEAGDEVTVTASTGAFALDEQEPDADFLIRLSDQRQTSPMHVAVATRAGELTWLGQTAASWRNQMRFGAAEGAVIDLSFDGRVEIPAGSVRKANGDAYQGPVQAYLAFGQPSTRPANRTFAAPLRGERTDGRVVPFRPILWLALRLADDSGDPLQSDAAVAYLTLADVMQSFGRDGDVLWTIDSERGAWVELGTAAYAPFQYTVSLAQGHTWAIGQPFEQATIRGEVVDCTRGDVAVPAARVEAVDVLAWHDAAPATDADGRFEVWMPPDADGMLVAGKSGATSEPTPVRSPGPGEELDVGAICLAPPRATVLLRWGEEPHDLDLHLTTPGDPRGHVFFGPQSRDGGRLLTDATLGFGPEVLTLTPPVDGVYRASAHLFDGVGTFADGGTTSLLHVEGEGMYTTSAPAGGQGPDDVWAAWDLEMSGGELIRVAAPAELRRASGTDDLAAFSP